MRNLKVLDRLFYRPLLADAHMSRDLVERLFPNLGEVLAWHAKANQEMKEKVKRGFPIGNIGDILKEMVSKSSSSSSDIEKRPVNRCFEKAISQSRSN